MINICFYKNLKQFIWYLTWILNECYWQGGSFFENVNFTLYLLNTPDLLSVVCLI